MNDLFTNGKITEKEKNIKKKATGYISYLRSENPKLSL